MNDDAIKCGRIMNPAPYHLLQNIPKAADESKTGVTVSEPASTTSLPTHALNTDSAIMKAQPPSTAMIGGIVLKLPASVSQGGPPRVPV